MEVKGIGRDRLQVTADPSDEQQAFHLSLGLAIRERRRNAGLSQERLGLEAGLHHTYVSMLERGLKSPSIRVLLEICRVLDMNPSTLLADAEEGITGDV